MFLLQFYFISLTFDGFIVCVRLCAYVCATLRSCSWFVACRWRVNLAVVGAPGSMAGCQPLCGRKTAWRNAYANFDCFLKCWLHYGFHFVLLLTRHVFCLISDDTVVVVIIAGRAIVDILRQRRWKCCFCCIYVMRNLKEKKTEEINVNCIPYTLSPQLIPQLLLLESMTCINYLTYLFN